MKYEREPSLSAGPVGSNWWGDERGIDHP